MRNFLAVLLLALLAGCANNSSESKDLIDFIPESSVVILKLQDPDLFFSNLRNNAFLKKNRKHPLPKELNEKLSLLDYFSHKDPAFLALSLSNSNQLEFTFISDQLPDFDLDSVQNKMVETITTKKYQIKKYTLEDQVAFASSKDSIFIFSSSKNLLEESLSGKGSLKDSPDFQKALKASSPKQPGIFLNHERMSPVFKKWFPEGDLEVQDQFSNWTSVDAEISQAAIKLNGITSANDTLPNLINVFKEVGPAQNLIATVTPLTAKGFTSATFNNFSKLNQNLKKFRNEAVSEEVTKEKELLETAAEVGMIHLDNSSIFAVRTLDTEAAKIALSSQQEVVEDFREKTILKFNDSGVFAELLKPLISPGDLNFFIYLDEFILFSNTSEALKEVITAFQNDQVLAKSEAYASTMESLSTEASLLLVSNNEPFKKVISNNISEEYKKSTEELNFKNFPLTALQFIYQSDYAHVHAVLSKSSIQEADTPISQMASVSLGAPLATRPVFFKNHRTNGMDVAVQDTDNTLYLISPSGKIYWKKKLQSRILGEIQSIDILKNGRYQLAFATQNRLHVIDREGNTVKPFPLNFKDEITQPLAVFDYDNNRNYRFVIVQNRDLYMYDSKGRSVNGFNFSKAGDNIIRSPKHLRIGRKDYILVPEASGKLNILSRTGKTRVPVKEKFNFSDNDWYEYLSRFLSTNEAGELIKISQKGNVQKENLGLAEGHKIDATIKSLVTLSENNLTIKGHKVSLDFGLYTAPEIFYLDNKIYVSVTDTQAHKVYLFDSNGKLLPGFPVYGNSRIDLAHADRGNNVDLVVQGDDDSVLVYEIQ